MEEDSRHLVEEASRGDAAAIENLITRHVEGLQGFVRRRARDLLERESDADLLQSVCREVLEDVRDGTFRYEGEAAFKQWLYQAALLKIRDRRRYWGADKRGGGRGEERFRISSESGDPRHVAFLESVCSPSHGLVRREELQIVERAFSQLEEAQRQIIMLARIEGLSHKEIAVRLGISESNSRVLLSRALARLTSLARRPKGDAE